MPLRMIGKKGISNIVVISLSILLVIAGVVLVWQFILPLVKGLGKINNFSPTDNNSFSCTLTKARWGNESAVMGDMVTMDVEGNGCEGKTVNFDVKEDDGFLGSDPVSIVPSGVVFGDNKAMTTWIAEWQKDFSGDPEYYFTASIESQSVKSGLLSVSKTTLTSPLETCKTIVNNGNGRVNIVIFADSQTAQKYVGYFLSFYPMSSNKNAFNFYYIDSYQPQCEIYKGIAMLCRSKDMIKKAASCPNDYIMAIETHPSEIRSSAFLNIMSINSNLPSSVVQHEFGHVFAGLAEEYTPAILPKNAKNCVDTCDKFNVKDGCYQECSKSDYFRSIENGVMRTLSSNDYGKFDNSIMLQRLKESTKNLQITGGVIDDPVSECNSEHYYLLDGNYSYGTGNITINKVSLEQGCASSNGYGEVQYNISDNQTNLGSGSFNPIYIFSDGVSQEGINADIDGETYINTDEFILTIPKIEGKNETNVTIIPPTGGTGCGNGGCQTHVGLNDFLPV